MQVIVQAYLQAQNYFTTSWKDDLFAGISVAMVAIPQSMAYAAIAGVNPIHGLYTAIIPAIVAGFFSSSDHVVTGPTNTIALATSGVLIGLTADENYQEFVFALAIIVGFIELVLGFLNFGSLVRYISNAVLTGFLTGAAILIIFNQLIYFLGLPPSNSHKTLHIIHYIISNCDQIKLMVVLLGLINIILLLSLKKLHPKIPAAIITLLTSSLIVRIFNWEQNGVFLIRHIGDISNSNLRFRIPSIYLDSDIAQTLLSGAGAVAILSLLETVTVAKAIAQKNNQRIKPSREFISQGLASIIGGFFQCIPTSGSLSRSAVNYQEGANTRVSTALSGLIVFIALIVFKRWLGYIPMVSLASVVIVSAFHLVDAHHLKLTWKGRGISKIVLSITFITVIFLPLQLSIYLGTLLSIGIYLFESSRLKLSSLELSEEGKFVEHELKNVFDESSSIAIINIEGDLYFAAVDDLEKNIIKIFNANKKKIILRFRRTRLMASTGITALEGLVLQAKNNNIDVLLSGVAKDFYETLDDCGIKENIGEENIFLATDIPYQSTHQAFKFSVSPLSENEREMYYDTLRRH